MKQPADHQESYVDRASAQPTRQLEPGQSTRLRTQLREALSCLANDDAEGLARTLAELTRLGFLLAFEHERAQRHRIAALLGEHARLRQGLR